jgi:serine/threonine-protein kinase BUR1
MSDKEDGEVMETPVKKLKVSGPCSSISEYALAKKLGEGTFGTVSQGSRGGNNYAIKKLVVRKEEGMPITALREIKLLKRLKHENIIPLVDIAVKEGDLHTRASTYMVFPMMDHDLAGLLRNPAVKLKPAQIKQFILQLLKAMEYLHSQKIIHRDIKGLLVFILAANILINNYGYLKLADFGLAREMDVKMTTVIFVKLASSDALVPATRDSTTRSRRALSRL